MKQLLKNTTASILLLPVLAMASIPAKTVQRLTFYFVHPVTASTPEFVYPQLLINNQVQPENLDDIPGHYTVAYYPNKINTIQLRYGMIDFNTGITSYSYADCQVSHGNSSYAIDPDYNTITGEMSCTKVLAK